MSPEGVSLRRGSEPCSPSPAASVEESRRWTGFWHGLRATQSSCSRASCPALPRRGLWEGAGGRGEIPATPMCSPRFKDQRKLNWFLPLHGTTELCQSCPSMDSPPGGLGTSALCGAPEKPWFCSFSFVVRVGTMLLAAFFPSRSGRLEAHVLSLLE